jgi:hypothetical protein
MFNPNKSRKPPDVSQAAPPGRSSQQDRPVHHTPALAGGGEPDLVKSGHRERPTGHAGAPHYPPRSTPTRVPSRGASLTRRPSPFPERSADASKEIGDDSTNNRNGSPPGVPAALNPCRVAEA